MANDLAVRSSLPLQVLLYLNQWYLLFWIIVEALCFVFKGQTLPFASSVLGGEIALFIILFFVDLFRIYFGTKGNLTERNVGILISIIISIPCIGGLCIQIVKVKMNYHIIKVSFFFVFKGFLYFLLWQHYVLRIELIINAIQLVFLALEVVLKIIALIVFARSRMWSSSETSTSKFYLENSVWSTVSLKLILLLYRNYGLKNSVFIYFFVSKRFSIKYYWTQFINFL